jgi:Family of unknown function (DUF6516)
MNRRLRDHSLDTLLDLDGLRFFLGEKGHSVRFDVVKVEVSAERPHGLKYALNVHDPSGTRLGGFDNAYPVRLSEGPGGKRDEYDHKHRFRTVRAYEYTDAATLISDFWALARDILTQEGVVF